MAKCTPIESCSENVYTKDEALHSKCVRIINRESVASAVYIDQTLSFTSITSLDGLDGAGRVLHAVLGLEHGQTHVPLRVALVVRLARVLLAPNYHVRHVHLPSGTRDMQRVSLYIVSVE